MVIVLCYVVLVLYSVQSVDLYGICIYIYICFAQVSPSQNPSMYLMQMTATRLI